MHNRVGVGVDMGSGPALPLPKVTLLGQGTRQDLERRLLWAGLLGGCSPWPEVAGWTHCCCYSGGAGGGWQGPQLILPWTFGPLEGTRAAGAASRAVQSLQDQPGLP